jgi:hypothetical protein
MEKCLFVFYSEFSHAGLLLGLGAAPFFLDFPSIHLFFLGRTGHTALAPGLYVESEAVPPLFPPIANMGLLFKSCPKDSPLSLSIIVCVCLLFA